MALQKATRKQVKLKIALIGPSGSGKTYSALLLAKGIGKKIAFLDTERGSASLYSHLIDFDVNQLERFEPEAYIEAIKEVIALGYDVLIIDSLSHEWAATKQIATDNKKGNNEWSGWGVATPRHQKLIDTILQAPIHTICCMRSKTEWALQTNAKGKLEPVAIGLEPVQRPNIEYEFTTIFSLEVGTNIASTSKDRTEIFKNKAQVLTPKAGEEFVKWLNGIDSEQLQSTKNLVFVLLSQLGMDYETEEVKARMSELTGKESMKLWTQSDADKVAHALDLKLKEKSKKKEEAA